LNIPSFSPRKLLAALDQKFPVQTKDPKADLTDHVVEKGMDGIFYYMAKEEAAIRQNPVKRTTELLKKVFNK